MKRKILILDDDKDILDILSYLLTEEGYQIKAYNSGDDFGEAIRNFSPDLIVMDLILGNLDGRSICRAIKLSPMTQNIPVIMISARPDLRPSPDQPGSPDDFITKPFDLGKVSEKIRRYVS